MYPSMTQLLSHTFAHLTGSSFRLGGDECAESHAHAEEICEHVKSRQSPADGPTANIPEI